MKTVPYLLLLLLSGCGAEPQDNHRTHALAPAVVPADSSALDARESSIDVGAAAPAFDLPGSDGRTHKLSDYAGQHVVLAFFPKAFTGG